ncbi:MAG: ribokinase [candidate division KSB1 bacterium]|nr:ribokinase [candidate division KSB1 bacterium]
MGKVTVVGSYIVALVIDTDRIPVEGETVMGRNYHMTHGGKGSNMAACAARLDADTTFMGKIGRDNFGRQFLDLLQSEHVSSEGVLYSDTLPTAVGFIVFSASGTNLIVIDSAANNEFSPFDVKAHKSIIESSDVIISPLEIPLDTALEAARIARANNTKSILNPAPAVNMQDKDLSSVFALTPNETEGRVCLGLKPDDPISNTDLAGALLDLGAENIILTLGENGVLWASHRGVSMFPALNVQVVDSVGAGDAFNAGLAVGLSEDKPIEQAIAMGITTASLSTQKRETIESYPWRKEVETRIREILISQ